MLSRLYELLLEAQISKSSIPACVAIVLSPGDLDDRGLKMLRYTVDWSRLVGIGCIAIYTAEDDRELYRRIISELSNIPAEVSLHTQNEIATFGPKAGIKLVISLGFGGKREVAEAIKKLLRDVEHGKISPACIDGKTIENNLRFSQRPDLVIRAGGKQLSDFMIWQAAYSELYFAEVNWNFLRKIDFLRAIRDYQQRERRFGR